MKYEWYETGQDVLSTVGTGGALTNYACFSHLILIENNDSIWMQLEMSEYLQTRVTSMNINANYISNLLNFHWF